MLFIVDLFTLLTSDILLAPTEPVLGLLLSSLLFFYQILFWFSTLCLAVAFHNWYTPNEFSITLVFCCWLYIDLHCLPKIYCFLPLTRSLVCWYCHWYSAIKYSSDFRKFPLHLHSTIDRPMINPQQPWSSVVDCWSIHITGPGSIAPTDPVPGLLLSSLVLYYQIFL